MKIPVYTQDGTKSAELAVSEKIFGHKVNQALIHKILVAKLGNKRHPIAHTRTKGEVRGGGKKPHQQKHTGRARQGSIKNPHHRGGGVAFGPRNTRNFNTKILKKELRGAILGALSAKFKEGQISALESFEAEAPKTKFFAAMLSKLPFKKKVIFVLPEKDETFTRCSRNISRVKSILARNMGLVDVLNSNDIVFLKAALQKFEDRFLKPNVK